MGRIRPESLGIICPAAESTGQELPSLRPYRSLTGDGIMAGRIFRGGGKAVF